MKRYIRTKDDDLIDLKCLNHSARHSILNKIKKGFIEVETNSDNFYDLMSRGLTADLTDKGYALTFDLYGFYNESNIHVGFFEFSRLFILKGDDYVLVAEKVNGEWRVL